MTHADPTRAEIAAGRQELRAARRQSRALFRFVALFSVFVNALMLTGPLYMLNVYDRVLGSRSVETLVALSVLVGFLYLMMALLDYARGRVMSRAGARFQSALDRRVFMATLDARAPQEAATGQRDLENVQRLITSPVLMALFDLPWTPIFLLGIFIFHPLLGYLAIAGGGLLILLALANQVTTRAPLAEANAAAHRTEALGQSLRGEAEMVQSLGMRQASFDRWDRLRGQTLAASIRAGDHGGTFSAMTRAFRLFLQSAMLGLGAYLVLQDQLTAGAMIAGSILLGRALAPVEILINRWAVVQSGIDGWRSLARLLGRVPPSRARTALPPPPRHCRGARRHSGAPGPDQRHPAHGQLSAGTGTGDGGDRCLGRGEIDPGKGTDRAVAPSRGQDTPRWCRTGPARAGHAGQTHRIPAAAGPAFRGHDQG